MSEGTVSLMLHNLNGTNFRDQQTTAEFKSTPPPPPPLTVIPGQCSIFW